MYKNINTLAKLLNKEKEGQELINKTKQEFLELKKEPLNKRGIFLFSSNPLMAFSQNSMIADIFELIGIKNLTPKSELKRPIITSEYLIKQNPNLIIIGIQAKDLKSFVEQNPSLKATQAYKDENILFYENTHKLLRISPTLPQNIKTFKQVLQRQVKNKSED